MATAPPTLLARGRRIGAPLLVFIVLIVLWQVIVTAANVPRSIFPSPAETALTIVNSRGLLIQNAWPTLVEALIGSVASIVIAIPLGIILAGRGWLAGALFPLILVTQTIPKVALAPLLVVWLGFGVLPKYTLVFLVTFFPIVITTVTGIRSAPREMLELGAICKMSRLTQLRKLELPYALPSILSGVKVAMSLSLIAALVSEFVTSNVGLGALITNAEGSVNTPLIFAAIFVVSFLGYVLFGVVAFAERLLIPWHISQRPTP